MGWSWGETTTLGHVGTVSEDKKKMSHHCKGKQENQLNRMRNTPVWALSVSLQAQGIHSPRVLKKNQYLHSLQTTSTFKDQKPLTISLKTVTTLEWKQAIKLEGGYKSHMAASSQLDQQDGGTLALQNKWVGFWVIIQP